MHKKVYNVNTKSGFLDIKGIKDIKGFCTHILFIFSAHVVKNNKTLDTLVLSPNLRSIRGGYVYIIYHFLANSLIFAIFFNYFIHNNW